ncbi:hypothetical protein M758_12G009800 [Ceratodon purpureus]|uniref:Uncharacterized protein n=1 Tax=Ceratodon purpureus TaxID=3225 RepID=A0A8T0G4N2_CERPU|nr:hypothetical protein KC19_12G009200 [Ceratodon purpureus]KAG0597628.1 hypothetical protein M758_12G009800 [Ceratodon purpureus]
MVDGCLKISHSRWDQKRESTAREPMFLTWNGLCSLSSCSNLGVTGRIPLQIEPIGLRSMELLTTTVRFRTPVLPHYTQAGIRRERAQPPFVSHFFLPRAVHWGLTPGCAPSFPVPAWMCYLCGCCNTRVMVIYDNLCESFNLVR